MLARPAHCALCSSEGIYENTPLKSGAMPAPAPSTATAVLGKYEFGLGQEIRGEDSEQEQEEQEEEEGDTRGQEAVSFQVDIYSTVAFITNYNSTCWCLSLCSSHNLDNLSIYLPPLPRRILITSRGCRLAR